MTTVPAHLLQRLESEQIIWLASVRPDGRPHLVPLWFTWHEGKIYLCIQPESVKARNMLRNPSVSLALENGSNPAMCEGRAAVVPAPWPALACTLFLQKYSWDITTDADYGMLVEVSVQRWVMGG